MIYMDFTLLTALVYFFINLLICTVSRRHLTYKGVQIIMLFNNILLMVFCLYYWNFFILNYGTEGFSFKLNSNNWLNINYEILFKVDVLSYLFVLLVNVIGLATNFYILNYFKYEERGEEFILLINWFIFSMIFLVISHNFFTLIIGWELIGLTSFLLINFWRFKVTTLGCSFKAFTFNKFSDIFLMIGFCLLWNKYKTGNVDTILTIINLNPLNSNDVFLKSGICILISSCIKSAQILGHLWLPDSMEAPVPASSLIHSATLVSAGIYLLLKFYTIFVLSNLISIIFFIGSFTACYGGIVAASQSDMKKLLAYSTISHCGFIVASISLNNFLVTIVYLYLHGLFKALTFFCAGSIIKFNGTQDTRFMGMNKNQLVNIITLTVASINLGGLPFTFGYLYKFLFLNYLMISPFGVISYGLNIVGMLCSVVYVFKLIYYSCFDYRKGPYQLLTALIQNNPNWIKDLLFNFTVVKVIAFSIIYIFGCSFFFVIKFFFLKNYYFIFYSGSFETNDFMYLSELFHSSSHLMSIFYSLFVVTIFVLVLMNWRENEFFIEKVKLVLNLVGVVTFFSMCAYFIIQGNLLIVGV